MRTKEKNRRRSPISHRGGQPASRKPAGRMSRSKRRTTAEPRAASPKVGTHSNFRRRSSGFCCRRSEEHTSELQSHLNLVCRLLLEKKKKQKSIVKKDR